VLGQVLDAAYLRRGIVVAVTDQESADKIATVPGALGTSTLALLLAEQRPLKVLAFDDVVPNTQSISEGGYRLVKDLYFAVTSDPSEVTREFLHFLSSAEGVAILQRTGHVTVPFDVDNF
jgi:phosphate transport system substrate-binding protein